MAATPGLTRNRYIRLICVSAMEILGTIPLGTLYIVRNAKAGVDPWPGWAKMHANYSVVYQVPASIWKNNPDSLFSLEMYRWSLVLCAFVFFALFGFADEARRHYRLVYKSIASHIGYSATVPHGPPREYVVQSIYRSIATHYRPLSLSVLYMSLPLRGTAVFLSLSLGGVERSMIRASHSPTTTSLRSRALQSPTATITPISMSSSFRLRKP